MLTLDGTDISDDDSHITDPACVHNRPDGLDQVAEEKGNQVCRDLNEVINARLKAERGRSSDV
jgi:hypothetical protein